MNSSKSKILTRSVIASILILAFTISIYAYQTQHVVVILIDGVRYTESLGDTTGTYCPHMTALSHQGAVQDSTFNDSVTVTAFGIPATWMGRFNILQDTTYQGNSVQFCRYPTSWEYARHDLGLPANKAIYITPDYGNNTWLPSFYPGYGPDYWPTFVQPPTSSDNNQADYDSAVVVLRRDRPKICYIYLPDTDHAGHSGVWIDYIAKIRQADSLVNNIWNVIQADTIMANKTTMFVTNDHGRHDDAHGGFRNHGDNCMGCRHVMMLAIGPDIAEGIHVATPRASITDITRTSGELLGFSSPLCTGRIMNELFETYSCPYVPGDVNNDGLANGNDVVSMVNIMRGLYTPPYTCECTPGNIWALASDVNGSCDFNGNDVTYFVRELRGQVQLIPCPDCPPTE